MKIIGGKFKSRDILVPKDTRPVSLRLRKSCFDIIGEIVPDARVLDVFAGSGALGIESLSRGAQNCTFIDQKRYNISIIKKNCARLGLDRGVHFDTKDGLDAIRDFSVYKRQFDLIFLDPPYYQGLVTKALQALVEYDIVAPLGYIVAFCYEKDEFIEESDVFPLIDKRIYGQTIFLIYNKR